MDGIIYPSVRAEYKTHNIALKPESVKKIELIKAGMFDLISDKEKVFIDNVAYALDLGENKDNFQWTYVDRTHEKEIQKILRE